MWCPLKVAFQRPYLEDLCPEQRKSQRASIDTPSILPSTLSLTQVSLPASDSSMDSLKLGASLRGLREQGFAIVGGGMSVHNLHDMMRSFASTDGRGLGKLQPNSYSVTFLKALDEAMTVPSAARDEDKWSNALKLEQRSDFLSAHPTPEHFLRTCRETQALSLLDTDNRADMHFASLDGHLLIDSCAHSTRCCSR